MWLCSLRVGEPVTVDAGPVRVGDRGLEGDEQADPRVHGGPTKAVYLYPGEHYAAWRTELGIPDLRFGAFGENVTTDQANYNGSYRYLGEKKAGIDGGL